VGGPPAWGLGGGLTTLSHKTQYLLRITMHSLGTGWITCPAELIQRGGGGTLRSLPHQWKESIVPIHKKGGKTDCSNYRGISLLSTSYKILSNILLCRLIPYADEITGDYQCGFRCNRSTTDQIFYIRQILEKK
jgi:hypothetical protein